MIKSCKVCGRPVETLVMEYTGAEFLCGKCWHWWMLIEVHGLGIERGK